MKNVYRNFSFTLVTILSLFIGFSGNKKRKPRILYFKRALGFFLLQTNYKH